MQNIINKVIIWGHKLHSHTHSYIHGSFYKTFKYLNYDTYWFDDNDNITDFDFTNSLFLTEGQVDKNIPILSNSYYILHNINNRQKYQPIPKKNILMIQVYTNSIFKYNPIKINEYIYYLNDGINYCLFFPWATDLLPFEIDLNINNLLNNTTNNTTNNNTNNNINNINEDKTVNFIGMSLNVWDKVGEYCKKHNIKYNIYGGFSNNIDYQENMKLIQQSYIAPAVQNEWQVTNGYIPCRIFKNISYGKMGMTNNIEVYNLFNHNILYNDDINKLLDMGIEFENKNIDEKNKIIISLMEFIRDNHTYINRIQYIFNMFNIIRNNNSI